MDLFCLINWLSRLFDAEAGSRVNQAARWETNNADMPTRPHPAHADQHMRGACSGNKKTPRKVTPHALVAHASWTPRKSMRCRGPARFAQWGGRQAGIGLRRPRNGRRRGPLTSENAYEASTPSSFGCCSWFLAQSADWE